jgi:alkylhydroperoxidase family enzyme
VARIPPLAVEDAAPAARAQLDEEIAKYGRATNMKRTLAHSPTALFALLRWYDLHAEVKGFLGERLTTLFAHAVSAQTDCLICSTFFRRWLTEAGEDPDHLRLDDRERAVVEFGRQLAHDANGVADDQYAAVARHLTPPQVVTLTAFGGLMIATNVFNNALKVDLDEYLYPFRKGAT